MSATAADLVPSADRDDDPPRGGPGRAPPLGETLEQLFRLWVPIGVAAAMFIVLRDASGLLGSLGGAGGRGYTTSVLAGFNPTLGIDDLRNAIDLWLESEEGRAFGARGLLRGFVIADLVFIVAYTWLIRLGLKSLQLRDGFVTGIVATIVATDLLETLLTWIIVETASTAEALLVTMRLMSQFKWLAIAVAAVAALVDMWQRRRSAAARGLSEMAEARGGASQSHRVALVGQMLLVAVFVFLVAFPGGGALQQVPDLIRYQMSGAPIHVLALNVLTQVLLAVAIAASGLVGARTRARPPEPAEWWVVPVAAAGLSAVLVGLGFVVDGGLNEPALAPVGLVAAMWIAAGLATLAGVGASSADTGSSGPRQPSAVDPAALTWIGALSGAVLVAIGLGAVRAAAPFVLLAEGSALRWWFWGLTGLALAAVGGGIAQWLVMWAGRALTAGHTSGHDLLRVVIVAVFALSTALAGLITVEPELARHFGATGALAVAFSLFAAIVAGLQLLSRRIVRWSVTTTLGLGARTPWAGMVVVVWLLAGVLDTSGSYHDVRTQPVDGDEQRYADLDGALMAWASAQDLEACPVAGSVPLVMVAAPGGGIRAAYWTATALEHLFPDECARRRLFAVSGTSGGSVGAVVWQGAVDAGKTPTTAIRDISGDEALSATIAGMLLRDLPQPIVAVSDGWRDRAALLEDGWVEFSDVLGTVADPTGWTALGGDEAWAPVLVLNSASVTDGCRVLVANVGGLPTSSQADCLSIDLDGGPSRAAIDPVASLAANAGSECGSHQPHAATAALLSARFPYVTPSGTLHHCVPGTTDDPATTYAVDGGYYENSGILALLEMLEDMGPMTVGDVPVEPWIVVVDNHFRGNEIVDDAGNPNQLIVPIITATESKIISQSALEQAAATRLFDEDASCTRYGRIGPPTSPGMTAPLGWALSLESEAVLDKALAEAIDDALHPSGVDRGCLAPLLEALGSEVPAIGD